MSTRQTQNDVGAPTGSVETQIKELEQRIQERRRTIALKKQLVVKRIRNKSVGPVMLLLAATGGFALDRLARKALKNSDKNSDRSPETSPENGLERAASKSPARAALALHGALELLKLVNISRRSRG